MARTLVFRTNNVGSIPTGLIMKPSYKMFLSHNSLSSHSQKVKLRHSLRFVSLIPPHSVAIHQEFAPKDTSPVQNTWRLTFKKSYLILYWISYLSTQIKTTKSDRKVSMAILPRKRSIYTLTKAPMAHKTNSKEQYAFNFYNFIFTTTLLSSFPTLNLTTLQMAYVLHLTRSLFPVFETNLLFLKSFNVEHCFRDMSFLPKI